MTKIDVESVTGPASAAVERSTGPVTMLQSAGSSVSAIVPVYNGGQDLAACLTSLLEAAPPPDEIIVVGDGDTDGSSALAATFGVRVLQLAVRGGPAHARNCGARVAQGNLLYFVDADVCIHPDAIAQVRAAFRDQPGVAAVFGRYDDRPTAPNFLSQYRNLLHHYVHSNAREEASTFWGACGAIRRDVFMALGGFDAGYNQPCIEDIELGYRLKQAGYRIRLVKDLQVTHMKRWGVRSLLETDFFRRALPWAELILQGRRLVNDLNTDLASRASVVFTFALLGALIGMVWLPELAFLAGILMISLLGLNGKVYGFFWRKRGPLFALKAIPWHWLYYVYSGLAFAIVCLRRMVLARVRQAHTLAKQHNW